MVCTYPQTGEVEGIAFFNSQPAKEKCVGWEMGDCDSWKRVTQDIHNDLDGVYGVLEQEFDILSWNGTERKYEKLPDMIRRLAKEQFASGVAKRS